MFLTGRVLFGIGTVAVGIHGVSRYFDFCSMNTRLLGVSNLFVLMASERLLLGLAFVIASAGLRSLGIKNTEASHPSGLTRGIDNRFRE